MAVSILTITHGMIGHELISTAQSMLGKLPLTSKSLSVSETCNPDELVVEASNLCSIIDNGDGVLILTDIYGSTPSNICNKLINNPNVRIIAGVNLPMLIRVMNYPSLQLQELVNKALTGAHDGIVNCQLKD